MLYELIAKNGIPKDKPSDQDPCTIGPLTPPTLFGNTQWAASELDPTPMSTLSLTALTTLSLGKKWSLMEEAEALHKIYGVDFSLCFNYFFYYGYLFKSPDYFIMGEEAVSHQLGEVVWYIWYAAYRGKSGIKDLIKLLPYDLPYIAFSRPLRGDLDKSRVRYYSLESLRRRFA